MATATLSTPTTRIGPLDHGRPMSLDEFIQADFEEGWLYELARGVLEVTEVPAPSPHGRVVRRVAWMFTQYEYQHPGVINYGAGGGECRLRLPGMVSDRHPDQAIYLDPEPPGPNIWTKWVPHIVVEVLSPGGEDRDLIDKRDEYLRVGVREYWILDPQNRRLIVLARKGDTWDETIIPEAGVYRTVFLPGLEVRPAELLGPAATN
jgi:Uma2 family endonuclease